MKKLLIAAMLMMAGCEYGNSRLFSVYINNGKGWDYSSGNIVCDSVQMVSTKEAFVWIDGNKMRIVAENYIAVYTRK